MKLSFIFSNLNAIILAIWVMFFAIVAMRFFYPIFLKKLSFLKLTLIALALNIAYALFVTWGQYYVWLTAGDFTKELVKLPLPKQVPMPNILEWTRPLFENNFGYFLYYILGRVWLYVFISFVISFLLYFIFKAWKNYRGNFSENGPELILILMLIVGWPGIIIFIPLGFAISVIVSFIYRLKGKKSIDIEPGFAIASLVVLLFGKIIFSFL